MNNFTITLGNQQVTVEQKDDNNFMVHTAGGVKHLWVKQDNDGANHWFETPANNETPQSIEAGKAIEACLVENNVAGRV